MLNQEGGARACGSPRYIYRLAHKLVDLWK